MIKNIEIKNFRSIHDSSIELNPLTVIVGANSTGKSNLIKAIDFISDIAQFGLNDAIYNRGGFNEILPKQYKNLSKYDISIKIIFQIDPPEEWPESYGNLDADYEIILSKLRTGRIKIIKEEINVKSIFLLQSFLDDGSKEKEILPKELIDEYRLSSVKIYRNTRGKINVDTNIKFNETKYKLFLSWLGLEKLFNKKNVNDSFLKDLLNSLFNNVRAGAKNTDLPIISLQRPIVNFSQHLRKIVSELESISRYDLFINELRQEQSVSNSSKVSATGDNIPSVVKKFVKDNKEAWNRIVETMSNISPYFSKVYSESLRAGKEYIVFEEIFNGRPIESWEASDGTLRALAILLCLESHSEGSTILIEEPEHGLHPWAVKDLINHIRHTIEIKNIQVILTTHSQQVLECLNPEELLITERDDYGTHYKIINDIIPNNTITMGEIGNLWTKGLLNGVPKTI